MAANLLRTHAGFGLLIKAQINKRAVLLSGHGLHTPAYRWPHKKRDILLQGRHSIVIPFHRGLPLATRPYRFNASKFCLKHE